jgi:hypothetical protein
MNRFSVSVSGRKNQDETRGTDLLMQYIKVFFSKIPV